MIEFDYGSAATRGQRSYQEDASAVWPGAVAFDLPVDLARPANGTLIAVLADGMGGHAGGAEASQTVCRCFIQHVATSADTDPSRLLSGLHAANDAISATVSEKPQLDGMGSTMIGAAFAPDGLQWVSVGDSPLYLYRGGEIALLNEDHSLAPALDQLAAAGEITFEQARNDPRRHMLRSAITGEELDLVDVSQKPLQLAAGDLVILATDGIHTLEPGEVVRITAAYFDDGPQAIADALIRSIENHREPHQDNATIIVVQKSE
ncbi:MAG TPA: protein phosphatase 2C domain-containing protein [Hyphomicrobiaceae bacterium]|nr:protein phosphatase 2C domain-containing protein [Hyphomicrobiaceae bacterium]